MCPSPNVFRIEGELLKSLCSKMEDLPPPALDDDARLSKGLLRHYRRHVEDCSGVEDLREAIASNLRSSPEARGYLVLDCRSVFERGDETQALTLLTGVLTLVGIPMRVFDDWDLWKRLGTNTEIEPERATGVGYNPLHIDVVNSTMPPDFTCLLCMQEDPRGGGNSLVSNLQQAVDSLDPTQRSYLSEPVFREGSFYHLSGVGTELNPFPVLERRPDGMWMVRFTAKMLPKMATSPHRDAARSLERRLIASHEKFLLGKHQLLIVNQRVACHGRTPLGDGQAEIPRPQRRVLLQIFLRSG